MLFLIFRERISFAPIFSIKSTHASILMQKSIIQTLYIYDNNISVYVIDNRKWRETENKNGKPKKKPEIDAKTQNVLSSDRWII